jgi:hypothetical protein
MFLAMILSPRRFIESVTTTKSRPSVIRFPEICSEISKALQKLRQGGEYILFDTPTDAEPTKNGATSTEDQSSR